MPPLLYYLQLDLKRTAMGNNTITAVVVGALIVVVAFSLWPILNGATNSLYAYFRDSCDDGSGSRFLALYTNKSSVLSSYQYIDGVHGGAGVSLSGNAAGGCTAEFDVTVNAPNVDDFYDEHGRTVAVDPTTKTTVDLATGYTWVKVAGVLNFFSGINNILLAIIPVVSIGGFLGISGAKLYSYGRSTGGNIASHLSGSVFTLVALIITIIIAPVIMDSLVGANQVVESGQYRINNQFGTILELLFGAIPLLYIAGLVGLIGMQARSALMGNKGGKGSMM